MRNKVIWIIAICLIVPTLLVTSCAPAMTEEEGVVTDEEEQVTPPEEEGAPESVAIEAQVVRIIDGDTIEVNIEGTIYKVRYIGIDTPETDELMFAEATAKNTELVEGKVVRLEKDVSETDKYGRLLRYVYVGDLFVNAELVRLGYAQVITYPPDVEYQDLFLKLQSEAKEAGFGLWAKPSFNQYENSEYGYTINYPSNWTLEASNPESVSIWTPHDDPNSAMVFIYPQVMPISIPIEEAPTDWLRIIHKHKDYQDLTLLSSQAMEHKWDWFLEYTTTEEGGDKEYYETYFKRVGSSLYLIEQFFVSASKPPELEVIINSFEVTKQPPSNRMEFLIYEDTEHGYCIEYPQDWELIDIGTNRVILGVEWGAIFGFVTIDVVPSGMTIEEAADFYELYLIDIYADQTTNFKVTYSHILSGEWDWVLGFTYIFTHTDVPERGTVDVNGEAYIIQTLEYDFVVQWESEASQAEICKLIVDSFVLPEDKEEAAPPTPTTTGSDVQITRIFYDGIVPQVESDEYVEITNLGDEPQDLEGWVLKDIDEGYPSFTFPSYIIAAGATIRVYTNEIHLEWGGFSFGYGKAIWNNKDHDTAALYDAQGQEVSKKSY